MIKDGGRAYILKCIVKYVACSTCFCLLSLVVRRIQAVYRAYRARKAYRELWLSTPPKACSTERLQHWCADKVQSSVVVGNAPTPCSLLQIGAHTDSVLTKIEAERSAIDDLFAEIDDNIRISQAVFGCVNALRRALLPDACFFRSAEHDPQPACPLSKEEWERTQLVVRDYAQLSSHTCVYACWCRHWNETLWTVQYAWSLSMRATGRTSCCPVLMFSTMFA